MRYETIKARLPNLPGCYIFKDGQNIIYVGKAKSLRSRVRSYFSKDLSPKTELLMQRADDVEVIVTDNEVEALLLENNLIKQHQPAFNIDLKANVRYAYILLTDEKWPRVLTVRKKAKGTLYGPYVDGYLRVQLIKLVTDVCKLRICSTLPKKPCLQYHIGKCDAPCISNISHDDYLKNVAKAKQILQGKTEKIEQELETEMRRHSAAKEYEKAKEKRDQLHLLRSIDQYQKVETQRKYDQDVFASLESSGTLKVVVFSIKRGVISKREKFTLDLVAGQGFGEFLRAYYTSHMLPTELIVDQELEDKTSLETYFASIALKQVHITLPKYGEKRELLEMARQNASIDFAEEHPELAELSRVLKLKTIPSIIECFDISNLGATGVVGASVQYKDGKPNPEEYRRYEIRTVQGQDDFRSIAEAVLRRYKRLKEEKARLPDLIVIDGGKQQLLFARKAMQQAGVSIPMIALAKKEEEIYLPYLSIPVSLPRNNLGLKLLQRIRDSTHRYVLSYQRIKRKKSLMA